MDEAFHRQTAAIEDVHWWFEHRRRLADRLLGGEPVGSALDVGCGSGATLSWLSRRAAFVVGVDRAATALELARRADRPGSLVRGDAGEIERLFRGASFDLVSVFNVLYHRGIVDDRATLRGLARLVRPGGRLLLTEPAWRVLFRRHDRVDHGARRYRLGELTAAVRAAGLRVERASYFNAAAFLPALALAIAERLGGIGAGEAEAPVGELGLPPRALNRLLVGAGAIERAWIAGVGRMPLGVGAIVLGRRPGGDQVRMNSIR